MSIILLLAFISSTHSQCKSINSIYTIACFVKAVSATWNGTNITGPVLIYQDELLVNDTGISESTITVGLNNNGSLVCRSENGTNQETVGWRTPKKAVVASHKEFDFTQTRTAVGMFPSISRLSLNTAGLARNDSNVSGLWTCRQSGSNELVHVGMYGRGECIQYLLQQNLIDDQQDLCLGQVIVWLKEK